MKTKYEGTIVLNGEKYIVTPETSYGTAETAWALLNFIIMENWLTAFMLRMWAVNTGDIVERI